MTDWFESRRSYVIFKSKYSTLPFREFCAYLAVSCLLGILLQNGGRGGDMSEVDEKYSL